MLYDMMLVRANTSQYGLYVTSPPCLNCVRQLVDAKFQFVVYGYRESVDGHLPMDDIHHELTEGGIKSWRVSLD
jgi:deoxycytidylate deaminase